MRSGGWVAASGESCDVSSETAPLGYKRSNAMTAHVPSESEASRLVFGTASSASVGRMDVKYPP